MQAGGLATAMALAAQVPATVEVFGGRIQLEVFDTKDETGRLVDRNVQLALSGVTQDLAGLTKVHSALLQAASAVANQMVQLALHQSSAEPKVQIARPAG